MDCAAMDADDFGTACSAKHGKHFFPVKGILLDSLTQEGEPYATIKIVKKEAPAKALKMLVTDMKGQFQEKVPGTGNFVMTITSVGRTPIVKGLFCEGRGEAGGLRYAVYRRCFQ